MFYFNFIFIFDNHRAWSTKINTELKRSNLFVLIQNHKKKFVNINTSIYNNWLIVKSNSKQIIKIRRMKIKETEILNCYKYIN